LQVGERRHRQELEAECRDEPADVDVGEPCRHVVERAGPQAHTDHHHRDRQRDDTRPPARVSG
jgi:hypothetical protein